MNAATTDQKGLLSLVDALLIDRETILKAAIAEVAPQYGVKPAAFTTTYYRYSPKAPQYGNRLFTDDGENILV